MIGAPLLRLLSIAPLGFRIVYFEIFVKEGYKVVYTVRRKPDNFLKKSKGDREKNGSPLHFLFGYL